VTRLPRSAFLLALAALPALAGCSGRGGSVMNQRPTAPCPRVALLADAVDLTRYRPGARPDIGTVEVDARMIGFQARCDYAPRDAGLDVILTVQVSAERGPAATSRTAGLPFLIAVTEGTESRVLNKATDTVQVTFGEGERSTVAQSAEMMVRLPGNPQRAAEKVILVGFQLTPEQLAENQRRGVR
jgi:hypothetical protein